jgi:L-asparaginase/Glu-tRNA(Gln) amidotransferase subunit D
MQQKVGKMFKDSTSDVTGNVYITATGGTITTCGDYKIHTFTSDGTFCVSVANVLLQVQC